MQNRPAKKEPESAIHESLPNYRLKTLLEAKAIDANQINGDGSNGLHLSIKYIVAMRQERITILLENGTNVNYVQTGIHRNTPLHTFIANESFSDVKHIIAEAERLELVINYNLCDFQGKNTLILAAKIRHEAMALHILEHAIHQKDFMIDLADEAGMTALHYACALGMPKLAARLIEYGASMNCENKKNRTPLDCTALGEDDIQSILHSASINSNRDEKAILNNITDANCQDFFVISEIGPAQLGDIPACSQSLAQLDYVLDLRLMNSTCLFMFACGEVQTTNPIDYLYENPISDQAKQEIRDYFKTFTGSSVMQAVLRERLVAQAVLVEAGANYSWLLRSYSANNNQDQLSVLLSREDVGQYINGKGLPSLKTAMHLAAEKNNTTVCQSLHVAGAKLNEMDKDGNTPLHLACLAGRKEAVIWLVQQGADVSIKNKQQKSIFNILADKGLHELNQEVSLQLNRSKSQAEHVAVYKK